MAYKNPEEYKEYQAQYRAKHREEAKEYAKKWRKDNPEKTKEYHNQERENHKERRRKADQEYRKRRIKNGTSIQGWLIKRYEGTPCIDCKGVFPFIAMDFDHRPEETKAFGIGSKGQYAVTPERLAEIEKEISKCDLICANCHRVRTQERNSGGE